MDGTIFKIIEVVLIFGVVLAFGIHQLRDVRKPLPPEDKPHADQDSTKGR